MLVVKSEDNNEAQNDFIEAWKGIPVYLAKTEDEIKNTQQTDIEREIRELYKKKI
jgi:hypothetical protein